MAMQWCVENLYKSMELVAACFILKEAYFKMLYPECPKSEIKTLLNIAVIEQKERALGYLKYPYLRADPALLFKKNGYKQCI